MPESSECRKLMAGQLDIWFAQQLSQDDVTYNTAEYLEIQGDLDVGVFEDALRHTLSEVETYHLRFSGEGDGLRQHIAESSGWSLHLADVSSEPDPRTCAEDWMRADIRRPVNLREGPLFAQALFRVGPGRYFWYQRCHHIAVDGLSGWTIFARQAQIYASLRALGRPADGALAPVSLLIDADLSYRASPDFAAA